MTVCVLEGKEAILSRSHLLQKFAERCDQACAMHWLDYFLNAHMASFKHPYLVLVTGPETDASALQPVNSSSSEGLIAVALFFEYRVLGIRTGAFSTDDISGIRTIIAPEDMRSRVAALATEALMCHGAHVVLTSYQRPHTEAMEQTGLMLDRRDVRWTQRSRRIRKQIAMGDTYESTLAQFGKSTRVNFRYYRKRITEKRACTFVANAHPLLTEYQFAALNAGSMNPVTPEECRRRFKASAAAEGGFMVGVRAGDGEWLSLLGGWRQGSTTMLHWQCNAAGYEKYSLSTAARAFFLEHESQRGTRKFIMYGGTSHSMAHSFQDELAWDLIAQRRTLRAWILRILSWLVETPRGLTGRGNFLAQALRCKTLAWQNVESTAPALNEITVPTVGTKVSALY